jgi:DeoR family glycerol-3-phosphate regulon repressor
VVTNFRQREILDLARKDGKVTVEGLAEHYDVTVQTIRRDLAELTDSGQLERVHGGAVVPSGVVNIVYEERRRLNASGKHAIAEACAQAIPNGVSVFMNIGTSTEAVARRLLDHENLLIVTNNLNIANILMANTGCEIILTAGILRRIDGGLVGGLTAELVKQFKFDFSILTVRKLWSAKPH